LTLVRLDCRSYSTWFDLSSTRFRPRLTRLDYSGMRLTQLSV